MAAPQYVVVELRVDASNAQTGAAAYSAALDKAQKAADALTGSADKTQKAITDQSNAMKQAAAANDNAANGFKVANDNYQQFGRSLADRAGDFLNAVNHLKLLALGAYALSPAFRSFVNVGVTQSLTLVGGSLGLVSGALARVVAFAAPALSFFGAIALPIGAAVAAWQALNYVINLGSGLLDKYANAQRNLFASGVDDKLKELTKFQTDTISADQVHYATELGTRLADANRIIGDFFKVQLDLTDPALKLQAVWVRVVEIIAAGITALNQFIGLLGKIPGGLGTLGTIASNIPGVGLPFLALRGLGAVSGPTAQSPADAMQAARGQLAGGLFKQAIEGGNYDKLLKQGFTPDFASRFSALLLSKPPEEEKYQTNAYDRAVQSIRDQIDQLNLEAQGAGKTSDAYQELKVAHELNIAAMKAGIKPTDDMRAEWKTLADQISAATIALNQNKVLQEETFKGKTQFLSPGDAAAAGAAHQIDPTNWQAHLNDAGPAMARFNSELAQGRDLSFDFVNTFTQGMQRGQTAAESLNAAIRNMANTLIQMAEKQLVNAAFGSLFNAFAPSASGVLPGGAPLGQGGIGHNATGTDFWTGGPTWVGEREPEILNLPRGTSITPASALGNGGGKSQTIVQINNYVGSDTETQQSRQDGPDGEKIVIDIVRKGMARGDFDAAQRSRNGVRPIKVR